MFTRPWAHDSIYPPHAYPYALCPWPRVSNTTTLRIQPHLKPGPTRLTILLNSRFHSFNHSYSRLSSLCTYSSGSVSWSRSSASKSARDLSESGYRAPARSKIYRAASLGTRERAERGPEVKSDRAMVHGSDIHLRRMYDHHITITLAIKPHEAAPYYTSTLHISLSLSSTEPTTHELSQLARSYVKTCFVNSPPTSVGSTGRKARESQRADV